MRTRLSKSRIQSGRQCHKRLWLEVHRPKLLKTDAARQARQDEGNRFGELARELLGGGVLVEAAPWEWDKALDQTQALLAQTPSHRPQLFEAAFEHEGVAVRVDALLRFPLADRLIEVKASTSVKEEYLWDCAIQTWVLRGAGRAVSVVTLALVERGFTYRLEGNYQELLKLEDVTPEVEALMPQLPPLVAQLKAVADGAEPSIATGSHCQEPYPCPFLDHCRAGEPARPAYPVEDLPRAKALAESLRAAGYSDLRKVPEDQLSNPLHQRVAQAVRTGQSFVSPELLATLAAIPYPRYYLDFETIAFTVPRWLGTKPFQQIPFQFSCHVEKADGLLDHREFLDLTGNNPVADFTAALLAAIGDSGPILVWNQSFEASRLSELAEMSPEHADTLLRLIPRMVDLLPIYRAHYYHPDMHGSWSIKAVLRSAEPSLSYEHLAVADGGQAQDAYRKAIAANTTAQECESLRQGLLSYCERDTLAMVRLAHLTV